MSESLISRLGSYHDNELYIKREDLIPYSFGGNKVRKAALFFDEIDKGNYDIVVTYGTSSSNHCRVVANMAAQRRLPCIIISPAEVQKVTYNSMMMKLFGAEIIVCDVEQVSKTIDEKLCSLREAGHNPYFIMGGGHGNIGTQAYVDCYKEILEYEEKNRIKFDYIFHASGTGTTQAGLVCGKILNNGSHSIVGISIARKNPRGRNVVLDSVRSYLGEKADEEQIQANTIFVDDYTEGYGKNDNRVNDTIKYVLKTYGVPLDTTYTGKAFMGMTEYIKDIKNKNILFIHTGGTPLFFDDIKALEKED